MTRKAWEFRRPRERRANRPRPVRDDGPPFITGLLPTGRKVLSFEPPDEVSDKEILRSIIDGSHPQPVEGFQDAVIEAVLDEFLETMAEVGK